MSGQEKSSSESGQGVVELSALFRCRVAVVNGEDYYAVTRVLLDSGASANFVSRKLVESLGLRPTHREEGRVFSGLVTACTTFKETARLVIKIAGVRGVIQAFVSEDDSHAILIGVPGLEELNVQMHFVRDSQPGTLVTVSGGTPDSCRSERYAVAPDPEWDKPPRVMKLYTQAEVDEATHMGRKYHIPSASEQEVIRSRPRTSRL